MDYERLFTLADSARAGQRLRAGDLTFLSVDIPAAREGVPWHVKLPKRVRHPAGFVISGAPVRTFTRCALLLAGKNAFGKRYEKSLFYQQTEADLALSIASAYFNDKAPKGAFCCKQCTLAVHTVLEANAIHHFDGPTLAKGIRKIIRNGEWRFSTPSNPKMLEWALGSN
jgi:hypothetical protein